MLPFTSRIPDDQRGEKGRKEAPLQEWMEGAQERWTEVSALLTLTKEKTGYKQRGLDQMLEPPQLI